MIVDLEENSASALIHPQGLSPEFTSSNIPMKLNFPSGSIFNSESELFLCYNGQESNDCWIRYLDIIFDARGGEFGALGVLYGKHRIFIFLFYKKKIIN